MAKSNTGQSKKAKTGPSKATISKVKNKQANKDKRQSYRTEKDIRKANKIKDAAPKVSTTIAGEQVEISTRTRQGRKILDKMKRKAKLSKQERKNEIRHAGVRVGDDFQAIMAGKKTGVTLTQLEQQSQAQKLAKKQQQQGGNADGMNDDSETSSADDDDSDEEEDLSKIDPKTLTPAQREIYEMKLRIQKIQQLDAQIGEVKTRKEQKLLKKQQREQERQARAEAKAKRKRDAKDYSDEEEMNTGIFRNSDDDDSDAGLNANDIDSDEYLSDGDDDNQMGDSDDDSDDLSDSSDYEDDDDDDDVEIDINDHATRYKDIYRQLHNQISFAKNEKKHIRQEMLAQLYNDLPVYKPMPPKVVGLLKSKGQNVKEIEEQRKKEHQEKVEKIIKQRQKQLLEYDSDDDDSDADAARDSEDELFDFAMRQAERAKKASKTIDSDEEVDVATHIDQSVPLVKLKQQTKAERNKQRKEMERLWLEQREQRIAEAKARATTDKTEDGDDSSDDDVQQSAVVNNNNKPRLLDDIGADEKVLEKKKEIQNKQQKEKEMQERSEHRMMVLLDDGTWGYRDSGVTEDDNVKQKQVDLSQYVRLSKKEKRQQAKAALQAEKQAAMDPEEVRRIKEQKELDILQEEKRKKLLESVDAVLQQPLSKKQQAAADKAQLKAVMGDDDSDDDMDMRGDGSDEDEEDYYDEDDFDFMDEDDEEMEFETLKGKKSSKYSDDDAWGSDEDDTDNDEVDFETLEMQLLKQQLTSVESLHENRLERIRKVQLILAQLCTELLQNPHKHVAGGHLSALMKLCKDSDNTVKQLAIASAAQVFADILPTYRIKQHKSTTHAGDVKLSKDVRAMRTYENTLLKEYKILLDIYFDFVHKGLSAFYSRQHKLWLEYQHQQRQEEAKNKKGGAKLTKEQLAKQAEEDEKQSPYLQYMTAKVNDNELITEKQTTLYTVILKSACQLFSKTYNFNYNTQFASLLSIVLTSDYLEWSNIVTQTVSDVFKADRVGEATLEIVKTIGDVCKKRTGEKVRSPLLAVLLDIPFNANIIKYQDLDKARKDAEAKKAKMTKKNKDKLKGTLGAGHHFFMKQQEQKEMSRKQLKKALKAGKNDTVDDIINRQVKPGDDMSDIKKNLEESEAILSIEARQKTQTQVLSIVFTIFFRYLKQAPTIKTLYNYNSVNNTHTQTYNNMKTQLVKEQGTNTVLAPKVMLSKMEEAASPSDAAVVLTQTMLGIVTPPSQYVLNVILKGIMQFGPLINLELVLDIFKHLLDVIQAATAVESLPIQSSLLAIQCIFSLLQVHNSSIDIDLAPYYQTLYQVLWQLIYQPEYTFLAIKCIDLSILQRKHLPYRRVAAIIRRLYQVAMHMTPQQALPLLQCISQCCNCHPTIGAFYDNDRLQSGSYDLDAPNPDTCDAIATPCWEALAAVNLQHPYAQTITLHTLLSDLRLGSNQNTDGKTVGHGVDRSTLSIQLSTLEVPDEKNKLVKPRRVIREMAVNRLKPLDLYTAMDITKGGFVPDVEAPDAKKLKKLIHNEWYRKDGWLQQVMELKKAKQFDDFDLNCQSGLMNDILGGRDTVSSFLLNTDENTRWFDLDMGDEDEDEDEDGMY